MDDDQRAFAAPLRRGRLDGIRLRPVTDHDLGFLADLYAQTRALELAPVPWPDAAKRDFLRHQFDLQHAYYHANYPGADFLLVEREGLPIGRVYVYRSAGDIRLMDIALLESARGQGIGSALLAELIDESERRGVTISLHVEADNPAAQWYLRLGFEHWEDRGVYQYLGRRPRAQPPG